jgi:putative MATE family efflux protein
MEHNRLGTEKISKLIWEFSIPSIAGSLVYILYNIVDRVFISFGVGRLAIAGISIALPLFTFVLASGLFIGIGGGALISINLGKKDYKKAEEILGNAVSLIFILGIIFSILGTLFLDDILRLFGATPNNITYAKDYMKIIFLGTTFQLFFIGMNNVMRGMGDPKSVMKMSIIGCGLNIVLDPLFIFTFNMGIQGAALATVLSNIVVAGFIIRYFLSSRSHLRFHVKNLKLKKEIILGISSVGIAPFIMQMSNSVVVIFVNKNLNTYGGDIAIAAYGILNAIAILLYMPIVGIYQGTQPILGFNYGAKNYDRVLEAFKSALKIVTGISIFGFILINFFPKLLISPFINNDPELFQLTLSSMRKFYSMILILGFNTIGTSYFQAVGRAKITTGLNILKQCVLMIPLLYILPKFLGANGVWFALPIADFTLCIITSYFVIREFKKLKKQIILKPANVESVG